MKHSFNKMLSMLLLFMLLLSFTSIHSQVCPGFIKAFTDWIKQKPGLNEGSHAVGAKMSGVTIKDKNPDRYPWGFIYCAEGRVGLSGDNLIGRFTVVFSDRKGSDGKRFNPDKTDLMDVTIFGDGRVQFMLRSWGNATYFLQNVQCHGDGFITGLAREGGSRPSFVTIALRKEIMHPGSDGFRDWPR
jgi:hypothetical protein